MSVLMPDFARSLRDRATELAQAEHARRERRRRWLRGGGGAISLVLVAGTTAAAVGWWQPRLGSDPSAPPKASLASPSAVATRNLAVLRRPQTDADRGAASRYALRFPASPETTIYTGAVRLLGTSSAGEQLVLIPMRGPRGEVLCLWGGSVGSAPEQPTGRTTRVCAPTRAALKGRLAIAIGARLDSDARARELARQAAAAEAAGAGATRERDGGLGFKAPSASQDAGPAQGVRVMGLAPDRATRATVDGVTAAVSGNSFELTLPGEPARLRARFD